MKRLLGFAALLMAVVFAASAFAGCCFVIPEDDPYYNTNDPKSSFGADAPDIWEVTAEPAQNTDKPADPTTAPSDPTDPPSDPTDEPDDKPIYGESCDSKDEVALYILLYGELPPNYITKDEAKALGWTGGSLEPFAPGCCIGGDRFGNYEGKLPKKKGRVYYECDIDTMGAGSRGAKRIVFSNDGLIYYTGDHYESFTLLYGEEG